MHRRVRWTALAATFAAALGGCGSSSSGGAGAEFAEGGTDTGAGEGEGPDDVGGDDSSESTSDDASGEGSESSGEEGDVGLPEGSDFWVVYTQAGRVPGENQGITDLHVMSKEGKNPLDPTLPEPLSLTEFSFGAATFQWCKDSPELALGCSNGCFVDDNLRWLAVQLQVPGPDELDPESPTYNPAYGCLDENFSDPPDVSRGMTLQLGQIDSFLKAKLIKDAILTNVVHVQFAGDTFYYSKLSECVGAACRYTIYRVDLTKAFKGEEILTFPPEDHINLGLWASQYKGYFAASEDGGFLALQNPFFGAQQHWVWTDGNLQLLQQLCDDGDVQCKSTGTGAEHTDRDPVAVAPDYEWVSTITLQGSRLRAWRYPVYDDLEGQWALLMSVPEGTSYKTSACNHLAEDWQFTRVNQISYAPEGDSLLYLGRSECTTGAKARTDILELDASVLCSCKEIEPTDIRNITQNPDNSTASNIVISSFDVCPGGEVIAMVGTPKFDANGKLVPDSSTAHRNDTEVYLIRRDGKLIKQMSREAAWEVTSVRCIAPKTFAPGQ